MNFSLLIAVIVACFTEINGIMSHDFTLQTLQSKLGNKEVPIKEFSRYLSESLSTSDEDDIQFILYNKYINQLRDYYYKKLVDYKDKKAHVARKHLLGLLARCKKDMDEATPFEYKNIWKYHVGCEI